MTEINIYGIGVINEQDLVVEDSDGFDGEYKYKTRGSSGDIYINSEETIALKINHQPQEEEVAKQNKAGSIAPKIHYHHYPYTITMKDTDEIPDQYDDVGIIIMDYLNEDEWSPFPTNPNEPQLMSLFDAFFKLVTVNKLKNVLDITGHSGPHLFISKSEPYKIKIIDYDKFVTCAGSKRDFIDMVSSISRSGAFRINRQNWIEYKAGEYALHHFKTKVKKRKMKSSISKVKPIISKARYRFKKATKRKDKKKKSKKEKKKTEKKQKKKK